MAASTELIPVEEYAAITMPQADLMEVIRENLGGETISEFDLDRVKMPSGGGRTWSVPTLDGEEDKREVEGVIVYYRDARSYWSTPFEGGSEPPDCSSPDAQFAQGDPGVSVPTDPHGRLICAQCPHSQFGSAEGDSNAQACRLGRLLFLLTPETLLPLVVALPPTSVQFAKRYFLRLASRAVPYSGVVTKIGLDKTKSGGGIEYSIATFSMGARLEGEQLERIRAYAAELRPAFERTTLDRDEVAGDGPTAGEGVG